MKGQMKGHAQSITGKLFDSLFVRLALLAGILLSTFLGPQAARSQTSQPVRRVNVPYWASGAPYPSRAVFWFGQVSPNTVYTDVRLIYDDKNLNITFHVIDRRLWYDPSPTPADLTQWDSISLYLDLGGNNQTSLNAKDYRFDAQLNWFEARSNFQAGYSGSGISWVPNAIPFSVTTGWRGNVPNDNLDDKGWVAEYKIPFSSLGLSGPPSTGTIWGLAAVVHNRDDQNGPVLPDTLWPEWINTSSPATWGQLRFGIPGYKAPEALTGGVSTIRQGSVGSTVMDAAVGGGFNCGSPYGPTYWEGWGSANYANDSQINIQNEWDISDWPCFSKYYVTYPLDNVPKGRVIISAVLTMFLTGNSWGGSTPPDSYIQVFTVGKDWNEATITWNNAPLANENISGAWVKAKTTAIWPTYTWDVSRAVAEAYAAEEPLRLALYSADGDYHTGKYFSSSDWTEEKGRPFLSIRWGSACSGANITCRFSFLPLTRR